MGKQNKEYDIRSKSLPIWVIRIYEELNKQGLVRRDLEKRANIPASTFSEWVNPNKKRQPSINGLRDIAKALDVSTDYLLGENECTTPENEEIHKMTGLSDLAIRRLKQTQKKYSDGSDSAAKRIVMCNYLLENMNKVTILDNLYEYLFGEFFFHGKVNNEAMGASSIVARSPSGKESRPLMFSSVFSHAYLGFVQADIVRMKDSIDKSKSEQEKIEYKKWEEENKEKNMKELFETYEEAEKE